MKLKSFQIFKSNLVLIIISISILSLAGCPEPPSSTAEITAFSFLAWDNSILDADAEGVISGNNISVEVPWQIERSGLIPSFEYTGAAVTVGSNAQVSGTTANDFSTAVVYTVTAEDDSTADYTVTVDYDHVPSFISSPLKTDIVTALAEANYVQAIDMDGDGDNDVVGTSWDDSSIHWWENTSGDGTVWTEKLVSSTVTNVVFALAVDIDGDGDHDIFGAAWNGDYISWWENTDGDGLSWTEYLVTGAHSNATCVDAADIDGDGDLDIFSAAYGANEITWLENTVDTNPSSWKNSWTKHIIDASYTNAYWVIVGDLTGDGLLDVVGASGGEDGVDDDGKFSYWINDGTEPDDGTPWTEVLIAESLDGAISIELADFDGDGDLDVCGAAWDEDTVAWFENNGDGSSWTTHILKDDFDYAITVNADDIDLDGDIDIVACARYDDSIIVWENSAGDASSWTEQVVTESFDAARWVDFGDIDGDSFPDVVAAGRGTSDMISWWKIIE